jgi:hypothetical protein
MTLLPVALLMLSKLEGQAFTSTADVKACQPLSDGRVLSATTGGLVLYGRGLQPERTWTQFDFLPGTDMRALAVSDDRNTVWAGGDRGVAVVRRGPSGRWEATSLASLPSVSALLAVDGRVLAGAAHELVVLDGANGRELARHPLTHDRMAVRRLLITSLASSPDGVRIGTGGGGLFVWDGTSVRPAPATLPHPYVHALAAEGARVLAATVGGVAEEGRAAPLSSAEVRALLRDGDGWLAATMGEGIGRLEDDGTWRRLPFPSPHVTALGRVGETTCAGTPEGTYVRQGSRGAWRRARVTGPPSNDVSALALDAERLWVGTFDRGLAVYEAGRFRTVPGLDDRVNALAVERLPAGTSRVWVATARGLASVEGATVAVRRHADGLPSDDVHAVAALRRGGALVGTARGAAIVAGDRIETLAKDGAPAEATWAVAEGPAGTLWLGTTNGLYRHRRGRPVRRFSAASGHLWDNWVTSILVDGASVWVGTYAGGVSHLKLGQGDAVEPEPWAGNAHVNPAGLSVARGTLWAATMEGIRSMRLDDRVCTSWGATHPGGTSPPSCTGGGGSGSGAATAWRAGRSGGRGPPPERPGPGEQGPRGTGPPKIRPRNQGPPKRFRAYPHPR